MEQAIETTRHTLEQTTIGGALTSVIVVYAGYKVLVALYNISPLHPLSRFPGPKLAAAGYFYEAYYDWIRGGKYTQEIKRMHEKYGKSAECPPFLPSTGIRSLFL